MKKTAWIARTAICLALLLCLQFVTKSLGQFVTGSCVNLVIAMAALIGGLILWKHRGNIQRLIQGNESKFSLHKKKEGSQ